MSATKSTRCFGIGQGEREAFRVRFEACKDGVYSVALQFSGSEEAAQDISQDVFLKLFHAIRGFRGEADFRTWLFRLVVSCFLCHTTSERRDLILKMNPHSAR
jgi:RNA polymerase sigma-70 factor (ECF subfamily)